MGHFFVGMSSRKGVVLLLCNVYSLKLLNYQFKTDGTHKLQRSIQLH